MRTFYLPISRLASLSLLLFTFIFSACEDKVELTQIYTVYEPVYMSPAEIRASIQVEEPQVLQASGKIYLYGDYLFIGEPGKGIHVINNADKANPVNEKFINLPGNYNFAIKGGDMYADSYTDLVVLDISDLQSIRVKSSINNIFAGMITNQLYDPERGLIVDWVEKDKITVSSEGWGNGGAPTWYRWHYGYYATRDFGAMQESFNGAVPSQAGIGGSMARFTIVNNYLYAIDHSSLYSFNIQNPESPVKEPTVHVGWGIETIFPRGEELFIGAQQGMHIFSISNPQAPEQLSMFTHMQSCDPVVVHENLAYVTLRGGTNCGGVVNQLDVINIQDLNNPRLLVSYPLTEPYGLAYDQELLFVCEGQHGLKVFDASDIYKIGNRLLDQVTDIDAYDVIPNQGVLLLIGSDGLYQFDYSDPADLKLISSLPIVRTTPAN